MRSLITAIHEVATSLNRIAVALEKKHLSSASSSVLAKNITSNSGSVATITSSHIVNPVFSSDLDSLAKKIYNAITDKNIDKVHNDYVMRDLAYKWPVLFEALTDLQIHMDKLNGKISSYPQFNKYHSDKEKNKIWKYK